VLRDILIGCIGGLKETVLSNWSSPAFMQLNHCKGNSWLAGKRFSCLWLYLGNKAPSLKISRDYCKQPSIFHLFGCNYHQTSSDSRITKLGWRLGQSKK